ncbi:MAG: WD40/YVTN/BNR-like repeat-containing protein [Anaerolineae bacterium]
MRGQTHSLLLALALAFMVLLTGAVSYARSEQQGHWVWSRVSEARPKALAFSPGFAGNHTVYLASSHLDTPALGFAYSTDRGRTWTVSNQGLPMQKDLMANCLVALARPGLPDTLLLAAEKRFHAADEPSGGLYRSDDGGLTWREVMMAGMPRLGERTFQVIEHLAVSPAWEREPWLVAAVRGRGIFVSRDGGAQWQQTAAGRVAGLAMSPDFAQDRTVFAALAGKGLLRSHDGGLTWAPATDKLQGVLLSLAISPSFTQDQTLFVGTSVEGVLRSQNGGLDWAPCGQQDIGEICMLALSPAFAQDGTIAAGSLRGKVFLSTDRGESWVDTEAAALREPIIALRFAPDFADSPRLWAAATFGGTWEYSAAADQESAEATATAVEAERLATLAAKPTVRPTGTPQSELRRDAGETGCITYSLAVPLLGCALWLRWREQRRPGAV